mgnify:FL=1
MGKQEAARQVEQLLRRMGRTVMVEESGERFQALLLPDGPSQTPEGLVRPTGREEPRRLTYYGPAWGGGETVQEGSALVDERSRRYRVLWLEDWTLGEGAILRWGKVLPEEKEDDGEAGGTV